jgi:hypothetical protein
LADKWLVPFLSLLRCWFIFFAPFGHKHPSGIKASKEKEQIYLVYAGSAEFIRIITKVGGLAITI